MNGANQDFGPASETYAGFAWEFLRRNEAYCRDYNQAHFHVSGQQKLQDGGTFKYVLKSDRHAHKWGLECFADPLRDSLEAFVIWRQSIFPGGLAIDYQEEEITHTSNKYCFSHINCTRHHFGAMDGERITVLKSRDFWLQLKGKPSSNQLEAQPFSVRFDGGLGARRRIDALRQLTSLTRDGVSNFKLLGRRKAHLKLRNALLSYDIRSEGGSYKDVAIALFGQDRIDDEWIGTGCFLKSRAIRSYKFAERMIEQDYQELLPKKAI